MIDKKSLEHIAELARLKLEAKELKSLEKDLVAILHYVDQLKKVDVSQVELGEEAEERVLREDKAKESLSKAEQLISLSPAQKKTYIAVKSVFKHGN